MSSRNREGKSSVNVGDDHTWRRRRRKRKSRKADDDHLQQEDCYREEQAEAGPPFRTRARLKRNFQLQQQPLPNNLNKPKQVPKKLNHEDQSTSNVDKRVADKAKKSPKSDVHPTSTSQGQPSAVQPLPQKHILELILDTLQRRDTYEIFAEPVDPEEVEDYYEIIKEPMDFGTMRAKLHEGMYTTLDQFEHDVFLISGNAMHFNSSATIFFRQARSIHELSKKLFHVLKTDPENFVLEFSGTRRRSCRRPQVEAKNLNCKSIPRHSSNVRPGCAIFDASSRGAPNSFSGPSIFKTSFLGNLGFASTAAHGLDFSFSFGAGNGRTSSFDEADRRYSYKPKMLFEHDHHSYVSGAPAEPKTLVPAVNQQDISYSDSLMRFVKDLGSTAQMVAKRKLQGLSGDSSTSNETPTSDCMTQPPPTAQTASLFPFLQTRPSTQNFIPSQKSHNPPLPSPTVPKQTGNVIDLTNVDEEENNVYNERFSIRGGMNFEDYSRRYKVTQKRWSGIQFGSHYSSSNNGDVVSSGISNSSKLLESSSSKSKAVAPVVPSEQSNASEFKLRNMNSSISSASWLSKTVQVSSLSRNIGSKHSSDSATQDVTLMKSSNVANNSAQESSFMEPREVMPSTSRFTFDLPFLKSQLSQMKFTSNNDDNRFLQTKPQPADFATSPEPRDKKKRMSFTKKVEQKGWPFHKNQPLSSFDNPLDTDLALQL